MLCFFSISIILRPTPDWERKSSGSKCVIFCNCIEILFFARYRFARCRCGDSKRDELLEGLAPTRLQNASGVGGCRTVACVLFARVLRSRQLKSITCVR